MSGNENSPAFAIRGLTKKYEGFQLGPLDLDCPPGTVMVCIGPNGAGKTTTLNCLAGLCSDDGGQMEIFGQPNLRTQAGWKFNVGYVGEHQGFFQQWSAEQNLAAIGRFYPSWSEGRVKNLASRFDLPLNKPVKALSKGNRAKLALVAALGHSPGLLLLDEPFANLDPVVRAEGLDVLWEFLEDGSTAILYSTHILSDIDRLADELVFLRDGKIVLRSVKDTIGDTWRRISFRCDKSVYQIPASSDHQVDGAMHRLISRDYKKSLERIEAAGPQDLEISRMTLDEIAVAILKTPTEEIVS